MVEDITYVTPYTLVAIGRGDQQAKLIYAGPTINSFQYIFFVKPCFSRVFWEM